MEIYEKNKILCLDLNNYFSNIIVVTLNYGAANKETNVKSPAGITHFIEHLLYNQLQKEIGTYGVIIEAKTTWTYTSFTFYFYQYPKDIFSQILGCINDFNLKISSKKIENEREIIKNEINLYHKQDQRVNKMYQAFINKILPDFNLDIDILGTIDSLNEINEKNLQQIYQDKYLSKFSNFSISFAGDINSKLLLSPALNYFYKLDRKKVKNLTLWNRETKIHTGLSKDENIFLLGSRVKDIDYLSHLIYKGCIDYLITTINYKLLKLNIITKKIKVEDLFIKDLSIITLIVQSIDFNKTIFTLEKFLNNAISEYLNNSFVTKLKNYLKSNYGLLNDEPKILINFVNLCDLNNSLPTDMDKMIQSINQEFLIGLYGSLIKGDGHISFVLEES